MLTLSAQAQRLLTVSHGVAVRVTASVQGSSFTYPVRFLSGQVQVSGSSGVRRSLSARVHAGVSSIEVDPFGAEWRVEYGLTGINGRTEWVPVGTFVLTSADEVEDGVVEVAGQDRWRRVAEARLTAPVTTSGSTVTAIRDLVQGADPRIVCNDRTGSVASHSVSVWERDRDRAVQDLARSIGAIVVFGPDGVAEIRPAPSMSDPVRWAVRGGDGGALISARQGAARGNAYNAVVAIGEPPDSPPVRAMVVVDDPGSPLLWGGRFGRRPRFYHSSLIETVPQALDAATGLLQRVRGVARTLDLEVLPHPGLDAGDVIAVQLDSGTQRHVVESFALPLAAGSVRVETRSDAADEGE